jgi:hypothetical protein
MSVNLIMSMVKTSRNSTCISSFNEGGNYLDPFMTNTVIVVCFQLNTFRLGPVFFDIETILIVVSSDNLNISSELDVFKASIRWISGNVMLRSISFHDTG